MFTFSCGWPPGNVLVWNKSAGFRDFGIGAFERGFGKQTLSTSDQEISILLDFFVGICGWEV